MAVFAHPDDESYSSAGTLATYAAQGVNVDLVCATRGEAGLISDPALAYQDILGSVREEELRDACRVMGIHQPHILGYRDSGMAGTEDNRDPLSFNMARPDEVVGKLVDIIRRLRPDVVITFDSQGIYGHPDHIAAHRHTLEACKASGDLARYPEQLIGEIVPYTPRRLFVTAIPRGRIEELTKAMPRDEDEDDLPEDEEINPEDIGTPDDAVTVEMNVSTLYETKRSAIACHRTQQQPNGLFNRLPEEIVREFFSREYFTQALPEVPAGTRYGDLFEGLEDG